MTLPATKATKFLERLEVPEGPLCGRRLKLAPFQRKFIKGALAKDTSIAALSIGRGNVKTALSSGLALGALLGGGITSRAAKSYSRPAPKIRRRSPGHSWPASPGPCPRTCRGN
jgi:hypothetical protein